MDQQTISAIASHIRKGGRVQFGQDYFGNVRIKVKYGPMNLFTRKYRVDHSTFARIKSEARVR